MSADDRHVHRGCVAFEPTGRSRDHYRRQFFRNHTSGSDDISGVFNEKPGTDMAATLSGIFVDETTLFTGTVERLDGTIQRHRPRSADRDTDDQRRQPHLHRRCRFGIYLNSSGTSEVTYQSDAAAPDNDIFRWTFSTPPTRS